MTDLSHNSEAHFKCYAARPGNYQTPGSVKLTAGVRVRSHPSSKEPSAAIQPSVRSRAAPMMMPEMAPLLRLPARSHRENHFVFVTFEGHRGSGRCAGIPVSSPDEADVD